MAAGTHAVRLEAENSDDDVNIDWLRLADGEESIKEYDGDHDGIPDSQELLYGTSTNLADTDSDGLNDRFELSRLGGYLSNPNQADTDSDGANDFAEWIAGTDPGNVASVFRIESIMAGDTSTIFFQSVFGRLYQVQGAADLLTPDAWVTLQSNLPGTNGLISVTDTNRFDRRYYRLRVDRPREIRRSLDGEWPTRFSRGAGYSSQGIQPRTELTRNMASARTISSTVMRPS